MTKATEFAKQFDNDGQKWLTDDGIQFSVALVVMDAKTTYSNRASSDANGNYLFIEGCVDRYVSGDPIRHVFPDGSAIVERSESWDIEGSVQFRCASLEKTFPAVTCDPHCYDLAAKFLVTDDKFMALDRERKHELTDRVAKAMQAAMEGELRQIRALLEAENNLEKQA